MLSNDKLQLTTNVELILQYVYMFESFLYIKLLSNISFKLSIVVFKFIILDVFIWIVILFNYDTFGMIDPIDKIQLHYKGQIINDNIINR